MTIIEGAGSYVVGEETALLSCLQGLRGTVSARPPFPAQRGVHGMPTVVNNVETLCNIAYIASHGADAYARLSPEGATQGSKMVCFNERFVNPGVYEVPFGMTHARAVRGRRRRPRGRPHDQGAADRRPARRASCPAASSTRVFDFDALAAEGCMVGHGGIVALRR